MKTENPMNDLDSSSLSVSDVLRAIVADGYLSDSNTARAREVLARHDQRTDDRRLAAPKPDAYKPADGPTKLALESIATNHDAMIILTQGYPHKDVAAVVDAHTARQVQKSNQAPHSITYAHEVDGPWRLELNGIPVSTHAAKPDLDKAITDLRSALGRGSATAVHAAVERAPIPWQSIVQAIRAVDAEAARRGEMFPQHADEQREDRLAARRVVEKIEWYANEGGAVAERLDAWPRAAQAVAPVLSRQPVATVVSRVGNDLRIGWLRPEQCRVGTQLYCAFEPTND